MPAAPSPPPFAKDDSKNPPATSLLDRLTRRFSRAAYLVIILGIYAVAATALDFAGHRGGKLLLRLRFRSAAGRSALQHRASHAGAPFKGGYYTLRAAPWVLHNALFYLVRFTFLPFVTLTPFGVAFLKAMGMKIGRHAFVNTEYISDPQLITLGDDVALGGSVRVFAHYGGGERLASAPRLWATSTSASGQRCSPTRS